MSFILSYLEKRCFFFSVYGFYILQDDMVLFMLCFSPKAIKYVNCLWEHWTLGFASAVQVVKDYQTMNCVSSTQTWIKPLLFHPPLPRLQKEVRCMWSGSRLGLFRIFCLSQSLPILLLSLHRLFIRQTRPLAAWCLGIWGIRVDRGSVICG